MQVTNAGPYRFETGIYRPPSEGGSSSLLLRFTRNCPWNKCEFCSMYKREKFSIRSVEEIKSDIDSIARLCKNLETISMEKGFNGRINTNSVIALMEKEPELKQSPGFAMVLDWLGSGAKTAFLQDANSLIMKTDHLVEVLGYLRKTFPSIVRVTSYARSKTIVRKSREELQAIHDAGLDRLHIGLESGDDVLLKMIKKGSSAEDHINGGKKAMAAGFQISEYWMPGLGGKDRWEAHATETARVMNAINPHYMRSRPFFPARGTPLHKKYESGEFQLLTPLEQLIELRLMIQNLDVTGKVCFDHAWNYWPDKRDRTLFSHSYEGYLFPKEKETVLDLLEEGIRAQEETPAGPPQWLVNTR